MRTALARPLARLLVRLGFCGHAALRLVDCCTCSRPRGFSDHSRWLLELSACSSLPRMQSFLPSVPGPRSGANVYMPDFEDSNCPTWDNMVQGQVGGWRGGGFGVGRGGEGAARRCTGQGRSAPPKAGAAAAAIAVQASRRGGAHRKQARLPSCQNQQSSAEASTFLPHPPISRPQINLRDAARGTVSYEDPTTGKKYALKEVSMGCLLTSVTAGHPICDCTTALPRWRLRTSTIVPSWTRSPSPLQGPRAIMVMRPRGWHLWEHHVLVDGHAVPGELPPAAVLRFSATCGSRPLSRCLNSLQGQAEANSAHLSAGLPSSRGSLVAFLSGRSDTSLSAHWAVHLADRSWRLLEHPFSLWLQAPSLTLRSISSTTPSS